MNRIRTYDPAAGLFLSPDPYVQAPDNTQNLNRYSYCLNNPLRYVDPTGETIWRTDDPDEIRSILEYITGKGYRNVTIEGIQNILNPNRWTEIPDDAFNTQDDKHLRRPRHSCEHGWAGACVRYKQTGQCQISPITQTTPITPTLGLLPLVFILLTPR